MLIAFSGRALANPRPMVFQPLGLDDGLSQSTVMDVHHDRAGFIWIATENGLNRFDGKNVTVFHRERGNPDALASDYVWAIDEDADGRLWFATEGGGVAFWDLATETFSTLRHAPQQADSLSSDNVRNVLVARSGRIVVANRDTGVDIVDPATRSVVARLTEGNGLPSNRTYALYQDRDGFIWIGTAAGLAVIADGPDPSGRLAAQTRLAAELAGVEVLSLHQDQSGIVWAGTFRSGLYRLDPVSERADTIALEPNPDSGDSIDVRAVFEDAERRLWVGTSAGLRLYDRSTESFAVYRRDGAESYGLSDDFVMSLSADRTGLIWVGTRSGGVDRWDPRSWLLGHRRPDWLGDAYVTSFAADDEGRFWVGSIGAELRRYTLATETWETLADVFGKDVTLSDPRVMSLATAPGGGLWVGTMDGGVQHIAPDGNVRVFSAERSAGGLRSNGIMALRRVDGRLLIGTFGGGVSALDTASGTWLPVTAGTNDETLASSRATAIAAAPDGGVWIATDGDGVFRLDGELTVTHHFVHDPGDPDTLASNRIYAVHVSKSGTVWLATAGSGLARIDTARRGVAGNGYVVSDVDAPLPSNVVYGILPDTNGRLWLSTNHGLARYSPRTGDVLTFHRENGLQHEEFNFGAYGRVGDDWLIVGGLGGFNLFRPRQLDAATAAAPRVALTGLELLNQPADLGMPLSRVESLDLAYDDDVVTFEFAALDYSNPEHVRYRYQLVGFDEQPVEAGQNRRVTYTNLAAGDYEFRVSAALPNSGWTDVPLALPIRVATAPWHSPLAYALYTLAVLSAIAYAYHRQAERLRRKQRYAEQLEREVAARTVELEDKNRQLKAASEAKSNFLARMSHEIRTPMNGVIGMTELLRTTGLSKKQHQLADVVSKSSQALLAIINDILDLSKVEAGRMTLETIEFSLREVFDDVICLLGTNARQRGVDLVSVIDARIGDEVRGDPVRIRQVLINLVGNALKFTESGEVVASVSLSDGDYGRPEFLFEVTDTGVGIEEAACAHIFSAFAQADESTTRRFGGTGLGLSICQQLVELMGGEIGVDSEVGKGSRFWFRVQLEHPRPRPAVEQDRTGRALVVAQSASLIRGVEAALTRSFAVVTVVNDVAAAESHAGEADVAAIVVDADSPDTAEQLALSGLGARNHARTVALASDAELATLAHCCDVTIDKPVRWPVLLEALGRAAPLRSKAKPEGQRQTEPERTYSVLIVEDNEVNQAVAEGMLVRLGCLTRIAANGREALDLLEEREVDLVLMDIQMPQLDGLEATRRLRAGSGPNAGTTVVGLTAQAGDRDRGVCIEAGMDDYLAKPFTVEQLAAVCERWLGPLAVVESDAVAISTSSSPGDSTEAFTIVDAGAVEQIRALETAEQPGIVQRVLNAFIDGNARAIDGLRTLDNSDLAGMRLTAHSMKASSANVGALAYAALWAKLEAAIDANDPSAVAIARKELLQRHETVIEAVRSSMAAKAA